jgi:hypothetical protein
MAHRALALTEKSRNARHLLFAEALTVIGLAHLGLRTPAAAIGPLERANSMLDPAKAHPMNIADTKFALARALWEARKNCARAIELARSAAKELAKSPPAIPINRAEVDAWLRERARGR